MKVIEGDCYGNLYPSAYMDDTGPMCAMCEECGRVGHIYDAAHYPFGLIRVSGWKFENEAWWVIKPRCKDKAACRNRQKGIREGANVHSRKRTVQARKEV